MTTAVFPLLRFVEHTLLFTFSCLQYHVNIFHRKDYDEQKAVLLRKHHYQGCQLTLSLLTHLSMSFKFLTCSWLT